MSSAASGAYFEYFVYFIYCAASKRKSRSTLASGAKAPFSATVTAGLKPRPSRSVALKPRPSRSAARERGRGRHRRKQILHPLSRVRDDVNNALRSARHQQRATLRMSATGASRSVKLAARHAAGWFARVAWLGCLSRVGEVTALFAAIDALVRPQALEDEFRGAGDDRGVVLLADFQNAQIVEQTLDFLQLCQNLGAGSVRRNFQLAAQFEPLNHGLHIRTGKILGVGFSDGRTNQLTRDIFRAAQLAFILQLEFPGHGWYGSVHIGDARDDGRIAVAHGALFGAAEHVFQRADGQALADAGAAVHALILARLKSHFFDDFADVLRHFHAFLLLALGPGFLRGDGHAFGNRRGIVGANFGADAVLQRGDDFSARGVIFGIGGEDQQHVEHHAHRIAFNLDVAFLHDVEQTHLNFSREVRQFVDAENATIGAGQQAVMNGELVGKIASAARGFDGVHVADHVRDGDVGRRELFHVAVFAGEPGDGRGVAFSGNAFAAGTANRRVGIVVNFAALDHRDVRVHESHQAAQNARLGLPAQTEQNKMMARENSVDDLQQNRIVVAMHAGKKLVAIFQLAQQVLAQFLAHAALRNSFDRPLTAAKLTEGFRQ